MMRRNKGARTIRTKQNNLTDERVHLLAANTTSRAKRDCKHTRVGKNSPTTRSFLPPHVPHDRPNVHCAKYIHADGSNDEQRQKEEQHVTAAG